MGGSVQGASTTSRSAVAGNFVVLEREFVVVRDFLVDFDVPPGVDDDLFLRLNGDDLCTAVRLKHAAIQTQSRQMQQTGANIHGTGVLRDHKSVLKSLEIRARNFDTVSSLLCHKMSYFKAITHQI